MKNIDRDYDPALTIPDAAERLRAIVAAGRAAIVGAADARLGIPYGDTPEEYVDIYPAAGGGRLQPLWLFLHGGFWRAFTARDFAFVAPPLQAAGVSVAIVNYALCPTVTIDTIIEQCRAAFWWAWRCAPALDCDRTRIGVVGHSAGGHLAAMLNATAWERFGLPADPIAAIVPVSGLFDIAPLATGWLQPVLRIDESLAVRCSPVCLPPLAQAPALVTVGGCETAAFHRQSARYVEMLAQAGSAVETWTIKGCNHLSILDEFGWDGALTKRIAAIAHREATIG